MRDADVDAVLAVEAACHRVASYAVPRPAQSQGSWGAARDVLRQAVAHAASRYPAIAVRAEVAEGLAARILLDRAQDADMLVLGRTFHNQDHHHGAGPVIRACLRNAACPVVVIGLAEALANDDHVPDVWQRVLAESGTTAGA
jgi:nucleotide-binding universal stress UspA family protein